MIENSSEAGRGLSPAVSVCLVVRDLLAGKIDPLAVGAKIVQIFCTNDKETMKLKLIFIIGNFIFKLGCSNSEKALK